MVEYPAVNRNVTGSSPVRGARFDYWRTSWLPMFPEEISLWAVSPTGLFLFWGCVFLCIHPFADGNGRVSRLLTVLLLHQADYTVGRYISIERLIEESAETYYEALQLSSQGWHEGKHSLKPLWEYSLSPESPGIWMWSSIRGQRPSSSI